MSTNGEPPLVDHQHHEEEIFRVSVSRSSVISTTETLIDNKSVDQSAEIVRNEGILDLNDGDLVNSSSGLDKNGIFDGEIEGLKISPNGGVREGVGDEILGQGGGEEASGVDDDGSEGGQEFEEMKVDTVGEGRESVLPTEKDSGMKVDRVAVDGGNTCINANDGTESVVATEKDAEDQNKGGQEYEGMKVDTLGVDGGSTCINANNGTESAVATEDTGVLNEGTREYEEMKAGNDQGTDSRSHRESNMGSIVVDLDGSFGMVGKEAGGNVGDDGNATKQKRKTRRQTAGVEHPEGCNFAISDLVWGKVKSHPWWPGQIIDPSYASEKAMKHFKKDTFFVAYFGDQTYAWNDSGSLKPFRADFPDMDKQSIALPFVYAVNSALDEVSRRVELGLSCSCTPEDIYDGIKSHKIINSGIKGELCDTDFVDRYFSVTSFEPDKLVKYIKSLALGQTISSDRLGFVISQAQLAAFYRWKGHFRLPYFHLFVGLSGDVEDATPMSENVEDVDIGITKLKSQHKTALEKRDNLEEKSNKKERSLTELMDQKISSGRKRKSVTSPHIDEVEKSKKQVLTPSPSSATKSPSSRAYRVGDRLLSIARQLSGSPPILKNSGDGFPKKAFKVDRRSKKLHEVDVITHIPGRTLDRPIATQEDNSSPDEMLSQLFLAAKDPTKGYSFLTTIVGFFTNFRNSISSDSSLPAKQKKYGKKMSSTVRGGKRRKPSTKITSSESDDEEDVSDTYWTDRIIQSSPEEKSPSRRKKRKAEFPLEIELKDSLAVEPETSHDLNPISDSKKEDTSTGEPVSTFQVITTDSREDRPDDTTGLVTNEMFEDKKDSEELTPTELILEFTNAKTVPSELDLNNIFSPFGSLKEETKILKKTRRAVVVFQRHDDADAAYNNACKYSVFGPALVSYELRPSRSPLRTTAQSRADATSLEDNPN